MCIIMPTFIDDITMASSNATESDQIVQELSQCFKLRDLGFKSFLLGIQDHQRSSKPLSNAVTALVHP